MPAVQPVLRATRQLWQAALDLLYPRVCQGCEAPLPPDAPRQGIPAWFCGSCREELVEVQAPYCAVCGEPYDGAITQAFVCKNCVGRRIAFDFAVSGYKAEGPLREMILHYKYRRDLSLRAGLADILSTALNDPRLASEDLSQWLLVPVPLHFTRQFWRGFNQSWELCRSLSRQTGIPTAQVLQRQMRTRPQARLHRKKRLQNLKQAFALLPDRPWRRSPDLRGRRILLVDDVLTTGATAHECAKILKLNAGVEKVVVITAARG
ncbi:ComF family protein [Prosthecobacter fusiformis]|uniref:ComF family protein n=1 Tax=Prosthecobacter fusiformis TaxID=48464 RepID=A0A4R7SQC4_9BACT|nr:ComF family protein [Prosthecobacter fusiformis]TDU81452.1 ComF family protein [Prosthecobacter fusiformis]